MVGVMEVTQGVHLYGPKVQPLRMGGAVGDSGLRTDRGQSGRRPTDRGSRPGEGAGVETFKKSGEPSLLGAQGAWWVAAAP